MLLRLCWAGFLFFISLPGLALWLPVFLATAHFTRTHKKTGPIWDTWDEIAQGKLVYGFLSGLCVWGVVTLLTLPFAFFTGLGVPLVMWITLRWIEDGVSAFRAFTSLLRLLRIGKTTLLAMYAVRAGLHERVMGLAVNELGLPSDPEAYFTQVDGADEKGNWRREKGRVRGRWDSSARYFSVKRRRKRDWNETLRWYDKVDYPKDEDL